MYELDYGHLLNKAGKFNYCKEESVGNLIRYIARDREQEDKRDELLARGVWGCLDILGTDGIIGDFRLARLCYKRRGVFGRYVDHEIYEFSGYELMKFKECHISCEMVARELARNIYNEGFQVFWGIHLKDMDSLRVHVHFAVNTVNFRTGRKRHENMTATKERQKQMQRIIERIIFQARNYWEPNPKDSQSEFSLYDLLPGNPISKE